MRLLRTALALVLSYALGVQPAVAQVQAHLISPAASAAGAAASASASVSRVETLRVGSLAPLALPAGLLAAPVLPAASAPLAVSAPRAAVLPVSAAPSPAARVAAAKFQADRAIEGLDRASGAASREKAGLQFAALTGEALRAAASDGEAAPPPADKSGDAVPAPLEKASAPAETPKAELPAPKLGFFQVFHDADRNKAFFGYLKGYVSFLFGFEMYSVGQPFTVPELLRNSLREHKDARGADPVAFESMMRSNRSLARIAHWGAQAVSYLATPLFTDNARKDGPRKWLVRSTLVRAAALAAVPVLFLATGLVGVKTALVLLFGIVAVQSFFQGVGVTAEGSATTRIFQDTTPEERTKANSILSVCEALIAIAAPLAAGQIARLGTFHGKTGFGYAVIYGLYAVTVALSGFFYSTVKMFAGPGEGAAAKVKASGAAASLRGTLKSLWTSIKEGARLIKSDRFLSTTVGLLVAGALFADPLVSNVIPDYVDRLAAQDPGSFAAVTRIPVFGWLIKTEMETPIGNYAIMMVMSKIGKIVATTLMGPVTRLCEKLGFKTEEALLVPFFFLAALEAPLFFAMIHLSTVLGVAALYGLQALSVGFLAIGSSGIYQKILGDRSEADLNKIVAAEALFEIVAAIAATCMYFFVFQKMALSRLMFYAALATGGISLLRLYAPFRATTKEERSPAEEPPPRKSVRARPAHFRQSPADHGGLNTLSVRL